MEKMYARHGTLTHEEILIKDVLSHETYILQEQLLSTGKPSCRLQLLYPLRRLKCMAAIVVQNELI